MKPLMSIASPSITGLPLAICCKPIIFLHSWVIIETISIIKHKKTSANLFLSLRFCWMLVLSHSLSPYCPSSLKTSKNLCKNLKNQGIMEVLHDFQVCLQ